MAFASYLSDFDVDAETNRALDVALEMTRAALGLKDDFANGIIARQIVRSSSVSAKTRSSLVLSPALPGRAVTRLALIFSRMRWWPSDCASCMRWCPRLLVLPSSSIRAILQSPRQRYGMCRKPPPPSG